MSAIESWVAVLTLYAVVATITTVVFYVKWRRALDGWDRTLDRLYEARRMRRELWQRMRQDAWAKGQGDE